MIASVAACPLCLLRRALPAVRAAHPRFACMRCGAHLRGPADVEGARQRAIAFAALVVLGVGLKGGRWRVRPMQPSVVGP